MYIVYDYDSNAILVEPLRNRQAATIHDAWIKLSQVLICRGQFPKMFIFDNECSADLKMRYLNTI